MLPALSTAMPEAVSLALPPKYVEYTRAVPVALSLVRKAVKP